MKIIKYRYFAHYQYGHIEMFKASSMEEAKRLARKLEYYFGSLIIVKPE